MKKVAIYIDGENFALDNYCLNLKSKVWVCNFYFSVKKKFNCKVDIGKFCEKLVGDNDLVKINYYIAPIEQQINPKMYTEQQRFFEKLRKIKNLKIIFGRLEKRKRDGEVYFIEKATDVNLALDLVLDAQSNDYDLAYLISNDGDFSGAVKAVVERFNKEVTYVAIGNNRMISHHLEKISTKSFRVDQNFINKVKLWR